MGTTATTTATEYRARLRNLAQSILSGIQRLEDLQATPEDDSYADVAHTLNQADTDVWATVDFIAEGRPVR